MCFKKMTSNVRRYNNNNRRYNVINFNCFASWVWHTNVDPSDPIKSTKRSFHLPLARGKLRAAVLPRLRDAIEGQQLVRSSVKPSTKRANYASGKQAATEPAPLYIPFIFRWEKDEGRLPTCRQEREPRKERESRRRHKRGWKECQRRGAERSGAGGS